MQTLNLHKRKTHRYSDGYRDHDDWAFVGTARLTPPRQTRAPSDDDFSDAGAYVRFARIPAGQDPHASAQALYDGIAGSRCRHEHDCCGCASNRVTVRRIGRRDFLVRVSVSRNY